MIISFCSSISEIVVNVVERKLLMIYHPFGKPIFKSPMSIQCPEWCSIVFLFPYHGFLRRRASHAFAPCVILGRAGDSLPCPAGGAAAVPAPVPRVCRGSGFYAAAAAAAAGRTAPSQRPRSRRKMANLCSRKRTHSDWPRNHRSPAYAANVCSLRAVQGGRARRGGGID